MSGSDDSQLEIMRGYAETAFRSDSIPKQRSLENPGGFAKALEGGDLIERLVWANYAGLNIHVRPSSAETYQKRISGLGRKNLAGPVWTHGKKPTDFIKTRWQLLLMVAGAFADYSIFGFFFICNFLAALIVGVLDGWTCIHVIF